MLDFVSRLTKNKKTWMPAVGSICLGVSLLMGGQVEAGIAAILSGIGLLSEGGRE